MLEFGGRSAGVAWVVRCGRLCGVVDIWFRTDRRERNGMGKHASLKKSEGKNNIVKQRTRGVGGFSGIKGRQQTFKFEFEDDLDEK